MNERNEHIGGTDASTIMHANKYQTYYDLWQIKTGRIQKPKPTPEQEEKMKWGLLLEKIITQEYLKERGLEFQEENWQRRIEQDFRVGHPDYIISADEIFDAKTTDKFLAQDWENGVPEYYYWQLVHYMGLTGAQFASIACLCGGNRLFSYIIQRDEKMIEALWKAEEEFHRLVVEDIEPELLVHPAPVEVIDMSPMVEELVGKYLEVGKKIKELESEQNQYKEALKIFIGKDTEMNGERYKASYKYVCQNKFDTENMIKDYNIDKEKYRIESGYYKLDVRTKK
ncbi:MAG TPA: YqaJ viral recombinase family protein [Spirochaetota bacterium]|nr:YqaJ viral recombinase family protein [Spirochaetota bacterium]